MFPGRSYRKWECVGVIIVLGHTYTELIRHKLVHVGVLHAKPTMLLQSKR